MFDIITQKISSAIIAVSLAIAGFFGYAPPLGETVQPVGLLTYTLSGSGVSSSATSITVSSFTLPQTGYRIERGKLSSTFYLTLEPGSRSRQEFVSCDGLTQNIAGTATFTGCKRGLEPFPPYTSSSTLQFAHAGGSSVVLSDPPQLFQQYANRINAQTITGLWSFSSTSLPQLDSYVAPTTSPQFAPKKYVDDTAVSGAPDALYATKGIVTLGSAAQASSSAATGPTSASPVVPTSIASAHFNGTTTVPVTRTDGYLDPAFIATNSPYTWTASTTFSGSPIILTGSTTDIRTPDVRIGGVGYYWPTTLSGIASGTVLTLTNPEGTASGTLRFQTAPGSGWEKLGQTVTTGAQATVTVSSLSNRRQYMIRAYAPSVSTGGKTFMSFQCCDQSYAWNVINGTSTTGRDHKSNNFFNGFQLQESVGTAQHTYTVFVDNDSGDTKTYSWTGGIKRAAQTYLDTVRGSGSWASTTQSVIDTVIFFADGDTQTATFGAGTVLTVFGTLD